MVDDVTASTIWGGPAPVRLGPAAVEISRWCAASGILRPLLIGGEPAGRIDHLLPLVHELEGEGVSVRLFDKARSADTTTVAEAVAAFHFEDCDGVIALGGAIVMTVAKAAALMVGQNRPFPDFVEGLDGSWLAIPARSIAASIAVPTTPLAAAFCGGAALVADDLMRACVVRHPKLRPDFIVIDEALTEAVPADAWEISEMATAVLAADAGCRMADLKPDQSPAWSPGRMLAEVAARLSGPVEAAMSVRHRLSVAIAVRKEVSPARALIALGYGQSAGGGGGELGLAGVDVHDAEIPGLARAIPGIVPEEVTALLQGANPLPGGNADAPTAGPPGRRRGGRRGRVAG
jgi:hypothetical protein